MRWCHSHYTIHTLFNIDATLMMDVNDIIQMSLKRIIIFNLSRVAGPGDGIAATLGHFDNSKGMQLLRCM